MSMPIRTAIGLSALLMFVNAAWTAGQNEETPATSEFLVHYQKGAQAQTDMAVSGAQRAMDMSARLGESLAHVRATKEGHQVLRAGRKLTRAQAWELATRMVQQGEVEFAHPVDPDFDARPPARPPISK